MGVYYYVKNKARIMMDNAYILMYENTMKEDLTVVTMVGVTPTMSDITYWIVNKNGDVYTYPSNAEDKSAISGIYIFTSTTFPVSASWRAVA